MLLEGSSICQADLTWDKYFKLTILRREWRSDQRQFGESIFLGNTKKGHPLVLHCEVPWALAKLGVQSAWSHWSTLPVPSPHAAVGLRPLEQRCIFQIVERGLDYLLKWHFQHLKLWQLGDFASPLESSPLLSVVCHHSPQLSLPAQMVVSEMRH